jgi:hypothetical protein
MPRPNWLCHIPLKSVSISEHWLQQLRIIGVNPTSNPHDRKGDIHNYTFGNGGVDLVHLSFGLTPVELRIQLLSTFYKLQSDSGWIGFYCQGIPFNVFADASTNCAADLQLEQITDTAGPKP